MNDSEYRDINKYPLSEEELMCLVIRETGTRSWSGHVDTSVCRFCCGILYSSRELKQAGMVLDDDGNPVKEYEKV